MNDIERKKKIEGAIFLVLFCLTIPAANWMIGHVGTVCVPNGPCLLPVAPGVMAPSGVLMIGIALVLRDLVQRRLGRRIRRRRDHRRRGDFGRSGAALAGLRLGRGVPAVGIRRFRRLYPARPPPAGAGGVRVKPAGAGGRTRSCSCGWPSARSTSSPARSSASSGWCCSPRLSSPICAAATSGSA